MRTKRRGRKVCAVLFILAHAALSAIAAYDVSDLGGTWSIHGVVSGVDPNVPGSFYMTGTADAIGLGDGTNYADSQGVAEATWGDGSPTPFYLSGGGIVSIGVAEAPFHGAMNWDEDLVVNVGTLIPGPDTGLMGYNLWMWVKQSPTPVFSIDDGAGTWWLHGLNSGTSGSAWFRGKLEIDGSGNFSFVEGTWAHSDGPSVSTPEDGSVNITDYGAMGFSFDPNAHGIMNLGKDLIVATLTDNTGGNLNVFQIRSGVTFSTADLAGTWHLHGLTAGDQSVWLGWFYGTLEVDSAGSLAGSITDSEETEAISDTLSITSDGIVAILGDSNTHGTMSDDKDLIVLTMDDGGGGFDLVILTRAIVAPVYRFWSPDNSRHFYTISGVERNYVQTTYASNIWTYETEAYCAFPQNSQAGLAPVYRFWSNALGAHFYTISEIERDYVIDNLPAWTYEGPVFYAYPEGSQPVDANPVYRFWSESLSTHFYTISEAEKDYVINNLPSWQYETVAWYAYE